MGFIFGLFLMIFVGMSAYIVGYEHKAEFQHEKCVAKYSYMPHNQVDTFCKELLQFKP